MKITAYHNTTKNHYENILNNGFHLTQNIRGSVFGRGIYFSKKPNLRWGNYTIKVQLNSNNPLIDLNGNIQYEDNELGKEVEAIGNEIFSDFHMSNFKQTQIAIDQFLEKHNYDLLATLEGGKVIYVVREPKIIKILTNESMKIKYFYIRNHS